jgi:Fis family transcriptional regulator
MLEVTLEQAGYNQSKAAKILGISRSTLRKKIAQYRIS